MKKLSLILFALTLGMPAFGATVNGVNRALIDAELSSKVPAYDQGGRIRVYYDEYTPASGTNLTGQDVIKMMKLQKGCRVYEVALQSPQLGIGGGEGALAIGIQASANSLHSANSQLFSGGAIEAGSADVDFLMTSDQSISGNASVFEEEVQVVITVDETTTHAGGDTIKLWVFCAAP